MPHASSNGLRIEYETIGEPADPAMLLIMGLGGQLVAWPDRFCSLLADEGFWVIRFDHRDVGLSDKIESGPVDVFGMIATLRAGGQVNAPYYLWDMASDAVGLLDHLAVDAAHVVAVSLGGMIAQEMAIRYPDRLLSLTSMMSTTGAPGVGNPTPEALDLLIRPPPANREEAIDMAVTSFRVAGSKTHPDEEMVRDRAARSYDRMHYPPGSTRHLAAALASGDRTEALRKVTVPTLVIHGEQDSLVHISGGQATAEAIPGARFVQIPEMGHDLPRVIWPRVVGEIVTHAKAHSPP